MAKAVRFARSVARSTCPVSPRQLGSVEHYFPEPLRPLERKNGVGGSRVTPFLVIALGALLGAPSAGGKLGLSLTIAPSSPTAGQPARVTLRARGTLPGPHGLQLTAVSAWRGNFGQTVLDIPLVRSGPRVFRATVRFPHRGRWTLIVPNEPSGGWFVRVRARR
jgi:hypothetical protein